MGVRTLLLASLAVSVASCAGPGHDAERTHAHEPYPLDAADARTIDFPGHGMGVLLDAHALEGDLVFLSEDSEESCGPGTVVSLPRGQLHGSWNATDAPARALLAITPARFGAFFDEVVAELAARRPEDPGTVGALIGEVAARYGCEVDGARVGPIVEPYGLR